jgi:aspartyl-tRNA(Asn)/glutamyl-tRNA(Gln) amidotransferase subunit A
MDILNKTLAELAALLEKKELSSRELVGFYLDRIERYDSKILAFLHTDPEAALKKANDYDEKRAKGEKLPKCAGLPCALKDLIVTSDMPTTCASKMLEGFISPFDATVAKNMREAGYISLGKLNMDQYAMGSSGESSYFQKTVNPWDYERVPGGSSSGSASAVAARLTPIAISSDTGGSIRQPAGFCGVTGLKPTYGRVSRFGVVSYASSLDQLGPITNSVEDAAFIMDTLGLHDPADSTSAPNKTDFYANLKKSGDDLKGIRLGLPEGYLSDLAPDLKIAVENALKDCEKLGAEIVSVDFPLAAKGLPVYQMIANAEAASNLAKYDGVKYGHRANLPQLEEMYSVTRREGFGPEVKKRIILGTYILLEGQYEEYYRRAMRIRRLIRRDYDTAFKKCDLIVGPVSAGVAFRFGDKTISAMEMYLNDLFTVILNLNGSCGISVPCGFGESGLPVGLQFQGDMFAEDKLLRVAHIYQKSTDWHKRVPALQGETR